MIGSADFSPCRTWRYSLRRSGLCDGDRCLMACLLNPSKADAERNDPTTTFMTRLAQREGCGRYEAVNAFALVDTYPGGLYEHPGPIGEWGKNDEAIKVAAERADLIVVAWGNHGTFLDRDQAVLALLKGRDLWCFGRNQGGAPRFPRALPSNIELVPFGSENVD